MTSEIPLLSVVALMIDLSQKGLLRGQVGTVIEHLSPEIVEVEFSDNQGKAYAQLALAQSQLLVLYYQPQQAA